MRRSVFNLVLMLGLLAALGLPAFMPQAAQAAPDLEALVRLYYQAVNRGDAAAATALFTDDGFLISGGACPATLPCKGKAEIQTAIASFRIPQLSNGVLSSSVSGSTVTARVELWVINVRNAGLDRLIVNATVTFSGDKISRFAEALDLSDSQSAQYANFARLNQLTNISFTQLQRGEIATLLGFFTEDAVFEGLGLCAPAPCAGKDAIRPEFERLAADHVSFTDTGSGARVSGNVRTGQRELRSDSIRAAGVDRILIATRMEAPGSQITSLSWTPIAEDAQTAAFLAAQGSAAAVPAQLPRAGGDTLPLPLILAVGGLLTAAGVATRRIALLTL